MILALKTDQPDVELRIVSPINHTAATDLWLADRSLAKDLLNHLESLLQSAKLGWTDLTGIVVFAGPGSFTGLRIGITVANTIAYAQDIPIVGVKGEKWREAGLQRLRDGDNDTQVVPFYGRDPHITAPRK